MATLTTHAAGWLDMRYQSSILGLFQVTYTDSSQLVLSLGGQQIVFRGSFTYNAAGTALTGGTVTQYEEYDNGVLVLNIIGMSMSALTAYAYYESNNLAGLISTALGEDDIIKSSPLVAGDDFLFGFNGNDTIYAYSGADSLHGGPGNDYLDGGSGIDTLIGGLGDDAYVVDAAGDNIVEGLNEGVDTVHSTVSYALGSNVEYLVLSGTGDISGTGNALDNLIFGNSGVNTLAGGAGSDAYIVQNAGDTVIEGVGEGTDTVLSSVSFNLGANVEHLTLTGTTGGLVGTGNGLNNTLVSNGAVLGNSLIGGDGNDTYVVRSVNDVVTETLAGGTDIVTAEVSFGLGTNVEHIFLLGFGNLDATGNELQNVIVGNLGANTLSGGLGDDIYFVQATGATIVEQAAQGRDTVFNSVTMVLDANVEDMRMQGVANINGTGNGFDNVLTGNAGNNILNGGAGADTLAGGAGNDTFAFNALSLHDLIEDFRDGEGGEEDVIDLSALGTGFDNLNFTVVNGTDVSMTVNGVADFSVLFQGYTSTVNFNAGDFLF